MVDPAIFSPEDSLTPTVDIVGILAHLAISGNLLSSRHRREQQLGRAALATLLGNIQTVGQPHCDDILLGRNSALAEAR
jgi:hypothetical protein